MRLLLPPKSEYTKASQNFGSMVDSITQKQKGYFNRASRGNIRSLQKTLQENQRLAVKYGTAQAEGTIGRLSRTLTRIKQVVKQNVGSIAGGSSYAGRSVARLNSITKNMPTGPSGGDKKTFAARYAHDLRAVQAELAKIEIAQRAANRQFNKASQEFKQMGEMLIGTFKSALMTSITLLTTLSYTIKGLAQDFNTFERELINANSIWQESNETLYEISDRVVKFGEEYGIAYDNASRVLYQFASAGLEAAEAQAVLNDVLILSMAVQGDANTIGKLTVQTIKGFGLEMSDAGEVTDKFAHAINASLIEYQDLASAIKFALPFYAATNQNLDQLLGSIQILTDRALEAGIAGRGLRQALAEFAEGAEDATRKFAEMGVKVVDAQGDFLQMTEIARNFADVIGGSVANDTELLTALIDDLNIRGATAFIHLVQNVDEFEEAVAELANSQGAAAKMADVQQNSLSMLTQKMRNAMKEVFFLSEAQHVANGHMNAFDMELKNLVIDFTELFLVDMPDGSKQLTDFAYDLRELVLTTLQGFSDLVGTLGKQIVEMTQNGFSLADMAKALFIPLEMIAFTLGKTSNILGSGVDVNGLIFKFYALSMVFGSVAAGAIMVGDAIAYMLNKAEQIGDIVGTLILLAATIYTGGGASLAYRGAGAATKGVASSGRLGALGTSNIFKSKKYAKGMQGKIDAEGWGGAMTKTRRHPKTGQEYHPTFKYDVDERFGKRVIPDSWSSDQAIANTIMQREMMRDAGKLGISKQQRAAAKWGWRGTPAETNRMGFTPLHPNQTRIGPQQVQFGKGQQSILGYQTRRDFARRQAQPFYELTDEGIKAHAGMLAYADDFAMAEGWKRMQYGSIGMYAGYKGAFYDGTQGYSSNAMMAQMNSSSYQSGGGQDLYINNAYVESNNFKDLFYSADQLGG